jgi:hypothetical protein
MHSSLGLTPSNAEKKIINKTYGFLEKRIKVKILPAYKRYTAIMKTQID